MADHRVAGVAASSSGPSVSSGSSRLPESPELPVSSGPSGAGSSAGICHAVGLDEVDVRRLIETFAARGWTVAVAESLTAGLVTAVLTEIPGASAVVRGGVVCYATDLKASLVGVDTDLLQTVGPVHPDVARALARGVRQRCDATIGVGLTGVAGPDAQGGHAPGTVFVAVAGPDGEQVSGGELGRLDAGDATPPGTGRASVRAAAVRQAIGMLLVLAQQGSA